MTNRESDCQGEKSQTSGSNCADNALFKEAYSKEEINAAFSAAKSFTQSEGFLSESTLKFWQESENPKIVKTANFLLENYGKLTGLDKQDHERDDGGYDNAPGITSKDMRRASPEMLEKAPASAKEEHKFLDMFTGLLHWGGQDGAQGHGEEKPKSATDSAFSYTQVEKEAAFQVAKNWTATEGALSESTLRSWQKSENQQTVKTANILLANYDKLTKLDQLDHEREEGGYDNASGITSKDMRQATSDL